MSNNIMKDEIQELVNKLNYYTELYDKGCPAISDKEWDDLYFLLANKERASGIYLPDSPTQRVVYKTLNQLKKVQHSHPMLSLNKTKSLDELNTFIKGKQYILMAKMDGLTCSLTYNNGLLVSAETRGSGMEGEDILHNAMVVKSIPKKIPHKGELTVDGEIICTYQNFEPFKEEYSHPRNFAAGSIRLLDAKESALRNLTFVAWDIIGNIDGAICLNHKLYMLEMQGFLVVPHTYGILEQDCRITEDLIELLKFECAQYGYPIDGLVAKYNDLKEYEACGRTDHHFKGGLAYKFYDEEYETWLKKIEWTMGRTGVLTPIAIFDPIEIDGTICERASLHNISVMKETLHRGYQGQTLMVYKANQIIPQIASAGFPESNGDIEGIRVDQIPTECPICGGRLEVVCEVDTEVLMCTNDACEGKLVNRLDHFCGKKGLDIKGLSKATLGKLVDWGWVSTYVDLYTLYQKRNEWIDKPGFGVKSVDNILAAIELSRVPALENFICALGIPHVGKTLSKELTKYFNNYKDFKIAAKNGWDFTQIDGVAYEKATAIWNFDFTEADFVDAFMKGYRVENGPSSNILEGESICITGRLTQHKNRDELVKRITDRGGKVVSGVSKNTTWLINNDINSTSSKNVTAQRLGIPIITEEEFINQFLSMEI